MMFYFLLLLIMKVFLAHGIGFSIAPFSMEVQTMGSSPFQGLSSFPMGSPMGLMNFPPIFNPFEVMEKDSEPENRAGIDIGGPMMGASMVGSMGGGGGSAGNVTTKNKTESKDGFKVTTITSDGPGFHSYIKEYEKEGNSSKNSTGPPMDIAKMLNSGRLFDLMNQLKHMGRKPQKCKSCGSGKFCDPIFHLCRKKFAEGRTCMAQKQCGKNLRCQWGKCQKVKKGDPGTFCKGNSDCKGDACCRNTPGSFHMMCIPQQTEGAICGLHHQTESLAKIFYVVKRSVVDQQCAPCKSGLKCADTGISKFKRCVSEVYKTIPQLSSYDTSSGNGFGTDMIGKIGKKHIFEAKPKPASPQKSTAKPAGPIPPSVPTNPKNPSDNKLPGTGEANNGQKHPKDKSKNDPSKGDSDVNGEDGKNSSKGSSKYDKKTDEEDEEEEEEEEEDGEEEDDGSANKGKSNTNNEAIPVETKLGK